GDRGFGIAVDAAGNAYVTGITGSSNFPTASPFQANFGGGGVDAFVAKIILATRVRHDFDGDGLADLLWRNAATGENAIWVMYGPSLASSALILPVSDAHWTIQGVGDFNGDGLSDILWRNTTTGENAIWFMNGKSVSSTSLITPVADANWSVA